MTAINQRAITLALLLAFARAEIGLAQQGDKPTQARQQQAGQAQRAPGQQRAPQSRPQAGQPQQRRTPQQRQRTNRAAQGQNNNRRNPNRSAVQQGNAQRQQPLRPDNQRPTRQPKPGRVSEPLRAPQQARPDNGRRNEQARGPQRRERDQRRIEQGAWQGRRARDWQSDHRSWQQRGGYNGYRIPDNRFGGYFGMNHGFRIFGLPFLNVGGYPRFRYGGYWFSPIDPWPEYWANDWYETDDVYIDYRGDGYYLVNRRYPGTGIAISVSM